MLQEEIFRRDRGKATGSAQEKQKLYEYEAIETRIESLFQVTNIRV